MSKQEIKNTIERAVPKKGFEFSEKQVGYLKTAGEVALAIAILGGVMALSAVAPNIFIALDKIFGKKQHGSRKTTLEKREKQLMNSFYYFRKQGYINIERRGELLLVSPTKKGRKRLAQLKYKNLQVAKPKRWNKTWWIVIADIPQEFRVSANYFQKKLKEMSFYPLQRTAWIHPFDPRKEIELVAAHYQINSFITIMEISRLDQSDRELLENFFAKKRLI